jgi:hypothetical protein
MLAGMAGNGRYGKIQIKHSKIASKRRNEIGVLTIDAVIKTVAAPKNPPKFEPLTIID